MPKPVLPFPLPTKANVLAAIADPRAFEAFRTAQAARAKAYREADCPKDDLLSDAFLIHGTLHLGRAGQLGPVTFEGRKSSPVPVETVSEFWARETKEGGETTSMSSHYRHLPPIDQLCAECGGGWTVETVHEAQPERVAPGVPVPYRHTTCELGRRLRQALAWAKQLCDRAALPVLRYAPVPNAYWGSSRVDVEPWIEILLEEGPIRLGYRKHVYEMSYGTVLDRDLFQSSAMTHAVGLVHCDDEDGLVRRLIALKIALWEQEHKRRTQPSI